MVTHVLVLYIKCFVPQDNLRRALAARGHSSAERRPW